MAEEKPEEVEEEGAEGEEGAENAEEGKKRFSGKKIVLFGVLPLLLLLAGGGGAYYFGLFGGDKEAASKEEVATVFFYDMPEMLVNLSATDKRAQYLKLKVALEIEKQEIAQSLNPVLPRIMDTFQVYLRELRSEDIEGSAGVYRLKEELLRRVNLSIAPHKVERVLFKEIIVQ